MSKHSASKLKIGDCVVVKLPDGSTQSATISDIRRNHDVALRLTRIRVSWKTGPGEFDEKYFWANPSEIEAVFPPGVNFLAI